MAAAYPPPIKLSVLRDIGWKEWDPIGLLAAGEIWDHQPFADEYDRYLLAVAGGFRRGMSLEDATQFCLLLFARPWASAPILSKLSKPQQQLV